MHIRSMSGVELVEPQPHPCQKEVQTQPAPGASHVSRIKPTVVERRKFPRLGISFQIETQGEHGDDPPMNKDGGYSWQWLLYRDQSRPCCPFRRNNLDDHVLAQFRKSSQGSDCQKLRHVGDARDKIRLHGIAES
jgi:hypothetical protein